MAEPSPPTSPQASLWILGRYQDLLLFVATPLLILPVIWGADMHWSGQEIYLSVAAFGALGHHLPGMMRAYGDRALFLRFPVRFILAPIFLVGVCGCFHFNGWESIKLIFVTWGVWHGFMQTYGFLRIYDAKVGSFKKTTTRLDFAMCAAWFIAADFWSPEHMAGYLELFYRCNGPVIDAAWLEGARWLVAVATTVITLAFAVNYWRCRVRGCGPSPVKLLLMGVTFVYWWFCRVQVSDMVVGIALFEIFHDVQYLSIVWIFNRNRAQKSNDVGAFTRRIFGGSGALIGVYVGLVFGYGYLKVFSDGMGAHGVKDAFGGALLASGLLHFYYDGFIWKVRERGTSESLGLKGGRMDLVSRAWFRHGSKWLIFVIPVVCIGWGEANSIRTELEVAEAVVRSAPRSSSARNAFGEALFQGGRHGEARVQFESALALRPEEAKARRGIGRVLEAADDVVGAHAQYQEALRYEPRDPLLHSSLGNLADDAGNLEEAAAHYRRALAIDGRDHATHNNLGLVLYRMGDLVAAERHYREAIRFSPNLSYAHLNLGDLAASDTSRREEALSHYARVLTENPRHALAHYKIGTVYAKQGLLDQAAEAVRTAVGLEPENEYFQEGLMRLEEALGQGDSE